MRRTTRLPSGASARAYVLRFAATDDGFPRVVGYGATPEEAERALEEKLPVRAPAAPKLPSLLPLSPAHGLRARPLETLETLEKRERSDDALDRAILAGSVDSNRRRH